MGNSEVGHNALGSGQVVDQGARLVDIALDEGTMFTGEGWKYIKPCFAEGTLHLIGLLSDGGVHSRYDQLVRTIQGAVKDGAKRIRVHVLTDGRDVEDGSSVRFVKQLEDDLAALDGCDARIASGGGRMCVTMDRYEADWNIVKRGWDAHVLGEAPHKFTSASEAIAALRSPKPGSDKPTSDQWLDPFVIGELPLLAVRPPGLSFVPSPPLPPPVLARPLGCPLADAASRAHPYHEPPPRSQSMTAAPLWAPSWTATPW